MDAVQDRVRETVHSVQTLFMSDVEMGKKDDDHNRHAHHAHHAQHAHSGSGSSHAHMRPPPLWNAVRIMPRKFFRRLLVLALALAAVYVFVKNIPNDLPVRTGHRPVYHMPGHHPPQAPPFPQGHMTYDAAAGGEEDETAPIIVPDAVAGGAADDDGGTTSGTGAAADTIDDASSAAAAANAHGAHHAATYNGQLRFLELAPTLRSITTTHGGFLVNKNILFAAASLKSMAALLPMACQMGTELRSYVHFVVMSRSDISVADLQQINGIDPTCNIFFHDARPDHVSISTDQRLENSVEAAMSHIYLYMHPQAIVIDASAAEEPYFQAGMRKHVKDKKTPLIELPRNGAKRLGWLTKLDSASLAQWNKISIDILIHAYPGASGSLIRLLQSMTKADFAGSPVPHVTIELPQTIDPPTEKYLETFQWPPERLADPSGAKRLSLRHRIPSHGVSEEESSIRFLESFWPSDPKNSHVLVLSPQTELSREFFHYVKFALLEYRYSTPALVQNWDKRLFGISLDLPRTTLDGTAKFLPPVAPAKAAVAGSAGSAGSGAPPASPASPAPPAASGDGLTSFLWQAPNSNAVLFLSERWVELHRFVSQLLDTQHAIATSSTSFSETMASQIQLYLSEKHASKTFPAWLEHALRLCQARGFWTLYPSTTMASALATVHDELYKPPEEYEVDVLAAKAAAEAAADQTAAEGAAAEAAEADGTLAGGSAPNAKAKTATAAAADDEEVRLGSKSLLDVLPPGGGLAPFSDMPLLAWDGTLATLEQLNADTIQYAAQFRRTVGGCREDALENLAPGALFCDAE